MIFYSLNSEQQHIETQTQIQLGQTLTLGFSFTPDDIILNDDPTEKCILFSNNFIYTT